MNFSPATSSARLLVLSLLRRGIRDIVFCPGSRNAPLGFAFAAAHAKGVVDLHVRFDERSAAFFALGLAIGSGKPSVVSMTSGTAVINSLPAFAEAHKSCIPLIVCSSNHPESSIEHSVCQTIDQRSCFLPYARDNIIIDLSQSERIFNQKYADTQMALDTCLRNAVSGPSPGPVHIDLVFSGNLFPHESEPWRLEENTKDMSLDTTENISSGTTTTLNDIGSHDADGECRTREFRENVSFEKKFLRKNHDIENWRPLIFAGSLTWPKQQLSLVDTLNKIPAVAEPEVANGFRALHPLALEYLRPNTIFLFGRPTLHRSVDRLLHDPNCSIIRDVSSQFWNIPDRDDVQELSDFSHSITTALDNNTEVAQWGELCDRVHREIVDVIETFCLPDSPSYPLVENTGILVHHHIGPYLQNFAALFLGASNTIRDFSLTTIAAPSNVRVFSNRGVAGIDGNISTALGIAQRCGPTLAVVGDLTFLHDMNAIIRGKEESSRPPLTLIVVNDQGGGIFSVLEQGDQLYQKPSYGQTVERLFSTPQEINIENFCLSVGVTYSKAKPQELGKYCRPYTTLHVIEVVCDRASLREMREQITLLVTERITNVVPEVLSL